MSDSPSLEARLEAVEKELAELKALVHFRDYRPWYEHIVGSMKDFPEFEEVLQLGREWRNSQHDPTEAAE
jgi:hypothetical protein